MAGPVGAEAEGSQAGQSGGEKRGGRASLEEQGRAEGEVGGGRAERSRGKLRGREPRWAGESRAEG